MNNWMIEFVSWLEKPTIDGLIYRAYNQEINNIEKEERQNKCTLNEQNKLQKPKRYVLDAIPNRSDSFDWLCQATH